MVLVTCKQHETHARQQKRTLGLEGWFHKANTNQQPNSLGRSIQTPRSDQELAILSCGGPTPPPIMMVTLVGQPRQTAGHLKNIYAKEDLVGVSGSFLVAAQFLHPFCVHDQKEWEKVWAEETWRAQTPPFQREDRPQKKAKG